MKKEDWINKVMSSIEQLEKVSPPSHVFSKIEIKIEEKSSKVIPLKWVFGIAASFLVLIFMNIHILKSNSTNNYSDSTDEALELIKSELDPSNYLY